MFNRNGRFGKFNSGNSKNFRKCSKCTLIFPLSKQFFHRNKYCTLGFQYTCLICRHKIHQHYNQSEKGKTSKKIRNIRNKKKFIRQRFEILKKYKFTCQYCGRKVPEVILHIDHIIPKSKGGGNVTDNLVVACRECNIGKSDVLLSHF